MAASDSTSSRALVVSNEGAVASAQEKLLAAVANALFRTPPDVFGAANTQQHQHQLQRSSGDKGAMNDDKQDPHQTNDHYTSDLQAMFDALCPRYGLVSLATIAKLLTLCAERYRCDEADVREMCGIDSPPDGWTFEDFCRYGGIVRKNAFDAAQFARMSEHEACVSVQQKVYETISAKKANEQQQQSRVSTATSGGGGRRRCSSSVAAAGADAAAAAPSPGSRGGCRASPPPPSSATSAYHPMNDHNDSHNHVPRRSSNNTGQSPSSSSAVHDDNNNDECDDDHHHHHHHHHHSHSFASSSTLSWFDVAFLKEARTEQLMSRPASDSLTSSYRMAPLFRSPTCVVSDGVVRRPGVLQRRLPRSTAHSTVPVYSARSLPEIKGYPKFSYASTRIETRDDEDKVLLKQIRDSLM